MISKGKQLLEQLKSSPLSEVTGVVWTHGVSGGRAGGESLWSLNMGFDAWKIGSGCIKTELLHITQEVTDKELKDIQRIIKDGTIVKISARVAEKSILGRPDALFEKFIEVVSSDNELNEFLEELKRPIIYTDSVLGNFTLDRKLNWYTGNIMWNGKSVTLDLSVDDSESIEQSLQVAKALFEDQVTWNNRICDYAASKLLQLKNEYWLGDEDDEEEQEDEVTLNQFKARISIETISIDTDGEFEFWYNDGDLFWGHSILVSGNLTDGPEDADICG